MQKTSFKGQLELIGAEAVALNPYLDSVGVPTIGVGHTAAAGEPYPAIGGEGITLREALTLFLKDLRNYEAEVRDAFTVPLEPHQFDAAVSFHFNTGAIGRAKWVKHVNAGDLVRARKAFMHWRTPTTIIPRRQKERDLFFDGTYHGNQHASIYTASKTGMVLWSEGRKVDITKMLTGLNRSKRTDIARLFETFVKLIKGLRP